MRGVAGPGRLQFPPSLRWWSRRCGQGGADGDGQRRANTPGSRQADSGRRQAAGCLDAEIRAALAGQCAWRRYRLGERVFERGTDGREVLFVIEGAVNMSSASPRSQRAHLRHRRDWGDDRRNGGDRCAGRARPASSAAEDLAAGRLFPPNLYRAAEASRDGRLSPAPAVSRALYAQKATTGSSRSAA